MQDNTGSTAAAADEVDPDARALPNLPGADQGDQGVTPAPATSLADAATRRGKQRVHPDKRAPYEGEELIDAVARGERLKSEEVEDATAWFLADEEDEPLLHTFELNVGGPVGDDGEPADEDRPPKWISWTIKPLDVEVINRINRAQFANRRKRDDAEAALRANLRIVVEATVDPDLSRICEELGIADPATALRLRFQRIGKTGLLTTIGGEVIRISGLSDDDVRDAREVKAARG